MTNTMKLSFSAVSENEAFARNTVAAFCALLDPTVDQLNDIKTAVSEAVTNAIVHAYSGGDGTDTVDIFAEIDSADTVHIVVSDTGIGIADIEHAMQPFFTTDSAHERSGMGFTVMESFMDSLSVEQNVPHGTVVSMTKTVGGSTDWNRKRH